MTSTKATSSSEDSGPSPSSRTINAYPTIAHAVAPLLVLSLVGNLAVLVSPLFMMQVLDRVIPSGNTATLLLLGALALSALLLQALVEGARDLALGRLARWTEGEGTAQALHPAQPEPQTLIARIAAFSAFLGGPAAVAALNLPWIPVFLLVLWLLHPAFLVLVLALSLAIWTTRAVTGALGRTASRAAAAHARQAEGALALAQEIEQRGGITMIARNIRQRFAAAQRARHRYLDQGAGADTAKTALSAFVRSAGQITALAVGAWLVTLGLLSPGGMIAGSIITAKGFMAIESALTQLPKIRAALADFRALANAEPPRDTTATEVGALSGALRAEGVIVPRGGGAPPRLDRVSFALKPGECLCIVGSSGSGKSTLLRALCGAAPAPIGSVFLDQNEIRGLTHETLHRVAGLLPQRAVVEVGTIAENISSFAPEPSSKRIVAAAKMAGVHGLICALPDNFETDLGAQPYILSAGQAQRVALARAIYTNPKYLFLDEPNALLDAEGERALGQTLYRLKQAGVTIVMVVHRSGILGLADKVLQLEHGRIADFGPRDEVLGRLGIGGRRVELPLLETSLPDLRDWIASQFTRASDTAFAQKAKIVGSELFLVGCANRPEDALGFAKFEFRFIDETQCELTMIEPEEPRIAEKVARVQARIDGKEDGLVNVPRDEAGLATVSRLSERFEVSSQDEVTRFAVALAADADEPDRIAS